MSVDRIVGKEKTIRELLSAKYSIDYYQREYKWTTKQIEELLNDLTGKFLENFEDDHDRSEVQNYSSYFLGSIIISKKGAGHTKLVDGQQRLTSLSLLLIFLNNLQKTSEAKVNISELIYSEKYAKRSFNLDVEDRAEAMEALFEEKDFDSFSESEAVQNIIGRYGDIEELFPNELKGPALLYFIDWLIDNVYLVEITSFSDDEAYTIFETMNDRGLSLSPIDMLKGYLLANMGPDDRTALNDFWKSEIAQIAAIEKDADSDFFKSWFRAQHAMTIRGRGKGAEPGDFDRIGSEFHRWVRSQEQTLGLEKPRHYSDFINSEFRFFSTQYKRLMHASKNLLSGFEHIYYNAQAGLTLQPMLLLAPLTLEDDIETINRKWRLVAKYLDILLARRIWNYRSVDQSTMKYPLFNLTVAIRRLSVKDLSKALQDDLNKSPESFSSNARFGLHGTNRKSIARILARLTEYVEVQSGLPSDYQRYTATGGSKNNFDIEHVLADKYDRYKEEFSHESDFQTYRNLLGGLLLLPKQFNRSFGDKPYAEKLPKYFGQNVLAKSLSPEAYSNFPGFLRFVSDSNLAFGPHENFGKAEIEARYSLYQEIAEKVWNPESLSV